MNTSFYHHHAETSSLQCIACSREVSAWAYIVQDETIANKPSQSITSIDSNWTSIRKSVKLRNSLSRLFKDFEETFQSLRKSDTGRVWLPEIRSDPFCCAYYVYYVVCSMYMRCDMMRLSISISISDRPEPAFRAANLAYRSLAVRDPERIHGESHRLHQTETWNEARIIPLCS